MKNRVALIAGSTGISGLNLATLLAQQEDWTVYGLARRPLPSAGVKPVAADLLHPAQLRGAIGDLGVTHAFFATWLRQENERKNCEVNGAMLINLLDALNNSPLQHVSLVTGGKTYFGSFEDSGNFEVTTPFREEQPRKTGLNFYYTQEDILFERAHQRNFTWNVHRPNTIIGYAVGNAMNMGTTLAVYASICKETGRPFVFPGSPTHYHGVSDMTDARMLAKQMIWAVATPAAENQAFNITNGDLFRWNWMWEQLAQFFGLEAAPYPGHAMPLQEQMKEAGPVWDRIVAKYRLKPHSVHELAPWWHTDADLGRTFETFADRSKSRALGFVEFQKTTISFFDLVERLRGERIIP
jgi:nucleoside-diphosphate-sugar epimerase